MNLFRKERPSGRSFESAPSCLLLNIFQENSALFRPFLASGERFFTVSKWVGLLRFHHLLSLCLFRINSETIHSMYKKNFHHLPATGKNCYYRMMVRQTMDWRRLLSHTVLRFECLLRRNGIWTESGNSCVIFGDTTLEKTVGNWNISPGCSTMCVRTTYSRKHILSMC